MDSSADMDFRTLHEEGILSHLIHEEGEDDGVTDSAEDDLDQQSPHATSMTQQLHQQHPHRQQHPIGVHGVGNDASPYYLPALVDAASSSSSIPGQQPQPQDANSKKRPRGKTDGNPDAASPTTIPTAPTVPTVPMKPAKADKEKSLASSDDCGEPESKKEKCRYDSSLSLLTKKFLGLISDASDGVLDLNHAAYTLKVQKRRIYDITNVLEGIGLIEKKSKNNIQWKGSGMSGILNENEEMVALRDEIAKLQEEDQALSDKISRTIKRTQSMQNDEENKRLAFITQFDLRSIESFKDDWIYIIRGPRDTSLEVPDPDKLYPKPQFQIQLKRSSSSSMPIKLYSLGPTYTQIIELQPAAPGSPSIIPTGIFQPETPPHAYSAADVQHHYRSMMATMMKEEEEEHFAASFESSNHHHHHHHQQQQQGPQTPTRTPTRTTLATTSAMATRLNELSASVVEGSSASMMMMMMSPMRHQHQHHHFIKISPQHEDPDFVFAMDSTEGISDLYMDEVVSSSLQQSDAVDLSTSGVFDD